MGRRSSLLGVPPRTRTVDDDLADSNMTRQDIAVGQYAFKRVWSHLRAHGWHARPGPALSYDHYYIMPGQTVATGEEGVDYFYGEANLVTYARSIELFGATGDRTTSSPSSSAASGSSRASDGTTRGNQALVSPTASTATVPTTMSSSGARATASPTVKTEGDAIKEEDGKAQSTGNGKRKLRTTAEVKPRQWPASHPRKGRHAADAICIDSESDAEEEEKEPVPPRPGNPGKRKARPIDDEDKDDDSDENDNGVDVGDDASVGTLESDATGFSEVSTTSTNSKRPLLTTRGKKKQKRVTTNNKPHYKPSEVLLYARKVKSGPRGLMFEGRSFRETLERVSPERPQAATHPTKAARKTAPASPDAAARRRGRGHTVRPPTVPSPDVASGLESQHSSTIKEEAPVFLPPSPPLRPPSRASSVASSHHSSSVTKNSETETLLDVEGVVFPACPNESYRVVITRTADTTATTIWMEERTSLEQRHITFADIRAFSDIPIEVIPANGLYGALFKSLIALGENVAVEPPNLQEPIPSATSDDASSINFIREESSEYIQLMFPDTAHWILPHRFPVEAVPEDRQVRALREELSRTNQELQSTQAQLETTRGELRTTQDELNTARQELQDTRGELQTTQESLEIAIRDRDAFKKQHEHLEREYQKLRVAQEHLKLHQSRPQSQSHPRIPSQSPPRAPSHSQPKVQSQTPPRPFAKTPAKAPAKTQAKTQPPPVAHAKSPTAAQPQPRSQPKAQAKSSAQPQPKAHQAQRLEEKTHVQHHHQHSSPARTSSSTPRAQTESTRSTAPTNTTPTSTMSSASPTSIAVKNPDPKTFHAQGYWLDTTFPKIPSGSSWVVAWAKLIDVHPTQYSVVSENGVPKEVTVNASGTYHLTMVLNHAASMLLSIVITSSGSGVRRLSFHPHLIQISPAANGHRYTSHFKKTIECSANDSMFAELQPCKESDPLSGRVERLEKFSPPSNDWRIEWKGDHSHMNGATNGKHSNGSAH